MKFYGNQYVKVRRIRVNTNGRYSHSVRLHKPKHRFLKGSLIALAIVWVSVFVIGHFVGEGQDKILREAQAYTPETPAEIIANVFNAYGIADQSIDEAISVMLGESGLDESAVGDGGNSHGVFQIHLPSHPEIGKDCAGSTYCAAQKMAPFWAKGMKSRCQTWTVYYSRHVKECNKLGISKKL